MSLLFVSSAYHLKLSGILPYQHDVFRGRIFPGPPKLSMVCLSIRDVEHCSSPNSIWRCDGPHLCHATHLYHTWTANERPHQIRTDRCDGTRVIVRKHRFNNSAMTFGTLIAQVRLRAPLERRSLSNSEAKTLLVSGLTHERPLFSAIL